jgi:hypothetical protein
VGWAWGEREGASGELIFAGPLNYLKQLREHCKEPAARMTFILFVTPNVVFFYK